MAYQILRLSRSAMQEQINSATAAGFPHYVYGLLRGDTGELFYVGKGTGGRVFQHEIRVGDNAHKDNVINKHGVAGYAFLGAFAAHTAALSLEKETIASYGVARDGGLLTNQTLGGDGFDSETMRAINADPARRQAHAKRTSAWWQSTEGKAHRATFFNRESAVLDGEVCLLVDAAARLGIRYSQIVKRRRVHSENLQEAVNHYARKRDAGTLVFSEIAFVDGVEHTQASAAERVGTSPQALCQYKKRNNCTLQAAVNHYLEKKSTALAVIDGVAHTQAQAAKFFKVSTQALSQWKKKHGLTLQQTVDHYVKKHKAEVAA